MVQWMRSGPTEEGSGPTDEKMDLRGRLAMVEAMGMVGRPLQWSEGCWDGWKAGTCRVATNSCMWRSEQVQAVDKLRARQGRYERVG